MTRKLSALALILASTLALPLFADDMMDPAKMTCAEFEKMDAPGMAAAIEALHMAGPEAKMMMDDAAKMTANEHIMAACKGKPDMLAMDAMMAKM